MITLKDAQKLRNYILMSGDTVSSFANRIGVAPATLTIMFQNKKISPRTAKLITEALDIEFNEIFEIKQKEAN